MKFQRLDCATLAVSIVHPADVRESGGKMLGVWSFFAVLITSSWQISSFAKDVVHSHERSPARELQSRSAMASQQSSSTPLWLGV